MECTIQKMVVTYLLLNLMLILVQISEARETVLELVSRLEPELRERAGAARHLAVPLPDSQFKQLVEAAVRQRVPVHAETEECRAHSNLLVNAITSGETWALRMFDASSKLPSGLLDGNFVDLGHYYECIGVEELNHMFTGQHCLVETRGIIPPELHHYLNFDLSAVPPEIGIDRWFWPDADLMFSVCVPSSCSARDVQVHMDHVLAPINATSILYDSSCSSAQPLPFRLMDYVAISIFLGIAAVVVWSTIIDTLSSEPKSGIVVAFSLGRNWRQLVETRDYSPGEDLPCLNGLRIMSTAGIVLAHRVSTALLNINRPIASLYEMLDSSLVAVAENLLQGVDVYFMIGGTVRAYSFLRDRYKGRPLDIMPSIARRYLRYTPTLTVVMLFTATLLIHSAKGPMWGRFMDFTTWCCRSNWITNILQISNYVGPNGSCVGEGWYLAADFQMFVMSSLFLIPLYFRPKLGIALLTLFGIGSMAVYAITAYTLEVDACTLAIFYRRRNEVMLELYFQAHLRLPSYLLGLGLGYLLFTTAQTDKPFRLSKVVLWMGWTLSLVSLAVLLVTTKVIMAPDYQYTPWLDVPQIVLSKFVVAAVAAWVVFVCSLGYGGIVNDFLSWRGFQPIARLALGVYLVHLGLIFLPQVSRQTGPFDIDQVTILYLWLGDLVIATAIAVPLYLCIELPCCKLASHYLITPIPYDPITASITAKKLKVENTSASKTYHPVASRPSLEKSSRKVKKKNKK